jgi:hypothetical protein
MRSFLKSVADMFRPASSTIAFVRNAEESAPEEDSDHDRGKNAMGWTKRYMGFRPEMR